jgi:hypothetical protein
MNHGSLLRELQTSLEEALRRADDRLSHVHRQLAGWQLVSPGRPPEGGTPTTPADDGWQLLEASTNALTVGVNSELTEVQTTLTELVQNGRALKQSLTTPP